MVRFDSADFTVWRGFDHRTGDDTHFGAGFGCHLEQLYPLHRRRRRGDRRCHQLGEIIIDYREDLCSCDQRLRPQRRHTDAYQP